MIRCPDCNAPVNRHDIYVERNRIYCRKGCHGVNQEVPNLSELELPPPVHRKEPEDLSSNIILTPIKHGIELTINTYNLFEGIIFIICGLFFIALGYIASFTNLFDNSKVAYTIDNIDPYFAAFCAFLAIVGLFAIIKGIWDMYGGYRVVINGYEFVYGKVFGKIWFKTKINVIQLVEVRKTLKIISTRKHYTRIGFFTQGKSKAFVPNYNMSNDEVDWLVYRIFRVWKPDAHKANKEAEQSEVKTNKTST